MKLTRRIDWQQRLTALVIERLALPFAWGSNDCVTFAAEAVYLMTDQDPMESWRGQWSNAHQALRVLQQLGGLACAVNAAGLQEVGPRMAQRGDLVLLPAPGRRGAVRYALGVCLGERVAGPGLLGLVMAPLGAGVKAWRV
jgi:hypothetical protein